MAAEYTVEHGAFAIIRCMKNDNLRHSTNFSSGANNALRTVAAPAGRSARANPAEHRSTPSSIDSQKAHAAGLMRVNHAGEVAAQALYQGHAAVARDKDIEAQMQRAADEEFDHLAWCEQRLDELGYEPSRLSPFWYAGAFAIGAASGVLGDKWSLGFIAETEKQVCAHLDSHLDSLPKRMPRAARSSNRCVMRKKNTAKMPSMPARPSCPPRSAPDAADGQSYDKNGVLGLDSGQIRKITIKHGLSLPCGRSVLKEVRNWGED